MSNVSITICGRQYTIACDPGDEAHVVRLGETVDHKIREIGAVGQSEVRQLLFAALFLADEVLTLKAGGTTAGSPASDNTGPSAEALEALAERLEKCAAALEG